MKIEFNTRAFEFSHGRKPRGRGSWAFQVGRFPDAPFFVHNSTYAEAKRAVVAYVRAHRPAFRGFVEVCP